MHSTRSEEIPSACVSVRRCRNVIYCVQKSHSCIIVCVLHDGLYALFLGRCGSMIRLRLHQRSTLMLGPDCVSLSMYYKIAHTRAPARASINLPANYCTRAARTVSRLTVNQGIGIGRQSTHNRIILVHTHPSPSHVKHSTAHKIYSDATRSQTSAFSDLPSVQQSGSARETSVSE